MRQRWTDRFTRLIDRFPGAGEAEIAALEAALGVLLPDDLRAFYRETNGCYGDVGEAGAELRLYGLDEIRAATMGYESAAAFGLVYIGDSGGDWGYALRRSGAELRYALCPFGAGREDDIEPMGGDFDEFLNAVAGR